MVQLVEEVKHTNESVQDLDEKIDRLDNRVEITEFSSTEDVRKYKNTSVTTISSTVAGAFAAVLSFLIAQFIKEVIMSDKIQKIKIDELPSSESIRDEDVFIESNGLETYKVAADDVAKYVSQNEHMTEKYVQSDLIGESDGIAPLNSSQKINGKYITYGTDANTAYEGSSGKMLEQSLEALESAIETKANASELSGHISNTAIHTAASEKELWNTVSGKADLTDLDGKADLNHTHNYAGSSSTGGSANSAVRLDTSAGSATNPVYFSGGKPVACTYTLGKSVPSDAVFTDTKVTIDSALSSTSTNPVQNRVMSSALDAINTEITAIKKSVSDGKSAVASAITAQGVNTATDTDFSTMASNITTLSANRYQAGVNATKVGTAVAANVLTGKTFTNASSVGVTGTMTDNGAVSKTFTPSTSIQSYTVPTGYHNGSGTVVCNAISTETKTFKPTTNSTSHSVTPTSGKYLTEVTVDTSNVYTLGYNAGVSAGGAGKYTLTQETKQVTYVQNANGNNNYGSESVTFSFSGNVAGIRSFSHNVSYAYTYLTNIAINGSTVTLTLTHAHGVNSSNGTGTLSVTVTLTVWYYK